MTEVGMARSRYDWTEGRIKRYQKEGRGSGSGASYKPWLTIEDVPSLGRVHRIPLERTGRTHHLLSDIEYYAFLNSAFDNAVVDIREQFPLDRSETRAIAAALEVKHPRHSGIPIVMTTDILETRVNSGTILHRAIAVKPREELGDARVVEKLEIERIYWQRRNVSWLIRSDLDLRTTRSFNLEWMYQYVTSGDIDPDDEGAVLDRLEVAMKLHSYRPLCEMCTWLDRELGFEEAGTSLQIVRRLLARKRIVVDLSKPILTEQPCIHFTIGKPPI
jgi:hypothetical protein